MLILYIAINKLWVRTEGVAMFLLGGILRYCGTFLSQFEAPLRLSLDGEVTIRLTCQ